MTPRPRHEDFWTEAGRARIEKWVLSQLDHWEESGFLAAQRGWRFRHAATRQFLHPMWVEEAIGRRDTAELTRLMEDADDRRRVLDRVIVKGRGRRTALETWRRTSDGWRHSSEFRRGRHGLSLQSLRYANRQVGAVLEMWRSHYGVRRGQLEFAIAIVAARLSINVEALHRHRVKHPRK